MGTFSIWHWLIVLAVVLLLFGGGGKIPKLMKDMGSGINAFRKGLKEDDKKADDEGEGGEGEPKVIEGSTTTQSSSTAESGSTTESEKDRQDRKAAHG